MRYVLILLLLVVGCNSNITVHGECRPFFGLHSAELAAGRLCRAMGYSAFKVEDLECYSCYLQTPNGDTVGEQCSARPVCIGECK